MGIFVVKVHNFRWTVSFSKIFFQQYFWTLQNYIYNYTTGDYRDVVHIRDVVVNYTFNYLDGNTGHYILTAYNSDNQQARQEYTKSGFTNNNSTALIESTIKIGSGQPFFENNYIYNEENDFELETYPKLEWVIWLYIWMWVYFGMDIKS